MFLTNNSALPFPRTHAVRHHPSVRARIVAVVVVVAFAASAVVVAVASTQANGLPSYTNGYLKWPKLNKQPTRGTPLGKSAHNGLKNVYASKRKVGQKYPNGTVIVKSIRQSGDRPALPSQVAVMRKVNGRWQFIEYTLSGARYSVLAKGQLCTSCHIMAKSNDYVFTKR
jgi:Cytochrome P460